MSDAADAEALRIVEACLDLPEAERDAFIDSAPGLTREVATKVRRMLALQADTMPITRTFAPREPEPDWAVPDVIGKFRVTGAIGRGGMGVVVRAERADGLFDQAVAIKLLRGDVGDARARERFANERRLLARLDHPGIARILDGGDVDGRPYLVMEYVEGRPLLDALDEDGADRTARLAAFTRVAEAVGEAHRRLVIHADIKPANIMQASDGAVKLLDFGIAGLIEEIGPAEGGVPHPLTPGYAAPERLAGEAPAVSGDVFSLGMLLREMLTGLAPGDAGAAPLLPPDLSAIIARAGAPEPANRYPDVAALLADLDAHRTHKPIAARRGERFHVARRFLRRHWVPLGVAALFAGLLIAATIVSLTLYQEARRERASADARFGEVRSLAKYQLFTLYDELAGVPGTLPARMRLANEAQTYLDRLAGSPDAPGEVQLETALGYLRLAEIQGVPSRPNLDQPAIARRNLDRATAMLTGLGDDPRARMGLAWARLFAADIAVWRDNDGAASEAILAATEPAVASLRADTPEWFALEAFRRKVRIALHDWRTQYAQEEAAASDTLAWLDGLPEAMRGESAFVIARAEALTGRGDARWGQERQGEALDDYRAADALLAALPAAQQDQPAVLMARTLTLYNLVSGYDLSHTPVPLLPLAEQMAQAGLRAQMFEPNDSRISLRVRAARSMLAQVRADHGQVREAIAVQSDLVAADRARFARHPDMRSRRYVATGLRVLGTIQAAASDMAAACASWREAMAGLEALRTSGNLNEWDRTNVQAGLARDLGRCT